MCKSKQAAHASDILWGKIGKKRFNPGELGVIAVDQLTPQESVEQYLSSTYSQLDEKWLVPMDRVNASDKYSTQPNKSSAVRTPLYGVIRPKAPVAMIQEG